MGRSAASAAASKLRQTNERDTLTDAIFFGVTDTPVLEIARHLFKPQVYLWEASDVNASEPGSFFGVCREGFVRLEPQVALGGKAQLATRSGDFR